GVYILKNDSVVEWRKTCSYCHTKFIARMTKPFPIRVSDFKVSHGTCSDCREKQQEEFRKHRNAAFLHWSFDSVKEYFEDNPPYLGQELLVHDTSWHTNTYAVVTVKVPAHTKQKRIVVESYTNGYSGQSFYRSGKNCFSPKGQVRLLPYNDKIGSLAKQAPRNEVQLSSKEVFDIIGEN
ncbi:TPA: hypothetical protein ACRZZI_005217, partial [Vibrio harveyi]